MASKKIRVPAVLAVATLVTVAAAAAACGNKVCKAGDPSCGGSGSTTTGSGPTSGVA